MPQYANLEPKRAGTQSIERGVTLLRLLATNHRNGLTLSEASRLSGLDISTTQRMLKALVRERLASKSADKRYSLGMLTFELGLAATNRVALIDELRPVMRNITGMTGDTCYLMARSGDEAVCLAREEGDFPIRTLILDVGGRRPLGVGASSLHVLAMLPDEEMHAIIQRNSVYYPRFHNINAQILTESVIEARRIGYGVNHSRLTLGVSGVGIAMPNRDGVPYLGIGTACISSRLDQKHCERSVEVIREAVNGWWKASGYLSSKVA